jgi:CheY-like chemotaxis protein/nitrogen-specific signal transduction histidine kinase
MTSEEAIDDLVRRLRDANQHLVIATVRAQELQAQAEATNDRQKEFLCMLAHELRNPLAPLTTATEILGMLTAADPKLPKLHAVMARQVSSLARLVGDLLDASRVSSGKFALKVQPLLLSDIVESAVETSQPVLARRNQQLSINLPSGPVMFEGDLVRLGQVFSNLLINAAKFTPEGGHITVTANTTPSSVIVSVKDDGIGIAPELQPVVFDLFAQGSSTHDGVQGGLGIGLSLVRTIVEMHGGTVDIHSDGLRQGSEFTVTLPILAPPLPRGTTPLAIKFRPLQLQRILIIADHDDTHETLKDFLTLQGHAVTLAQDGLAGLLLAKKDAYDVIICDIGLADIDDYEIIRQLRSRGTEAAHCFIALTCHSSKADEVRAIAAGFDHYLIKPVDTGILSTLLFSTTIQ